MRAKGTAEAGRPGAAPETVDPELLASRGWCTVRLLDDALLAALTDRYRAFGLDPGHGMFVSSVDGTRALARDEDQAIKGLLAPTLRRLLPDREAFLAAFITKGTTGGTVDVHQDWTYHDEREHRGVLLWCPLVDVDAGTGCLSTVDGSHLWSEALRGGGAMDALGGEVQAELWEAARPVPLAAGEAIVYDPGLLHGSTPSGGIERPVVAVATAPRGMPLVHARVTAEGDLEVFEVDEAWFSTRPWGERPDDRHRIEPWAPPTRAMTAAEVTARLHPRRGGRWWHRLSR